MCRSGRVLGAIREAMWSRDHVGFRVILRRLTVKYQSKHRWPSLGTPLGWGCGPFPKTDVSPDGQFKQLLVLWSFSGTSFSLQSG